ncbi:hypothetical protein J8273_5211 [Carpediemonas membranifera]|uniref:Uncharacterized protein n=1 Tax=Carpediemonas membranifera TaxID=201153 RepID=A0A8J6E0H3_9EUKA|nr:hypothetical protein J8273_5211 [Carpediemonas membranifera]|eukprot:KAG9392228.1 hypothetical protein J8273_5211 [Carpediemonas membranifera]
MNFFDALAQGPKTPVFIETVVDQSQLRAKKLKKSTIDGCQDIRKHVDEASQHNAVIDECLKAVLKYHQDMATMEPHADETFACQKKADKAFKFVRDRLTLLESSATQLGPLCLALSALAREYPEEWAERVDPFPSASDLAERAMAAADWAIGLASDLGQLLRSGRIPFAPDPVQMDAIVSEAAALGKNKGRAEGLGHILEYYFFDE